VDGLTEQAGLVPVDVQQLFRLHYLGLVRLAMRLVDDQETAEDLVQDVFLGLARRRGSVDDPLPYLRTAVVNRSRSALRRRRVSRLFLTGVRSEDVEPADEPSLREVERARLLTAVATLPRKQRVAVVLRYYEDLSVAEIARTIGSSPGAVSSALNRAMQTLSRITEVRDAD
jgi:RNA polymerase sigma-70 factor (sigma-E family)